MSQDSSSSPTPSKSNTASPTVLPISTEGSGEGSAVDLRLVDQSNPFGTSQQGSDVDGDEGTQPDSGQQEREDGESQRITVPFWLFAFTVVLAFCVIGWQARLASDLEARVAGLEQDVVAKAALIDAHRSHLTEIRGGVSELSDRLAGLQALVEMDPSEDLSQATSPLPTHP